MSNQPDGSVAQEERLNAVSGESPTGFMALPFIALPLFRRNSVSPARDMKRPADLRYYSGDRLTAEANSLDTLSRLLALYPVAVALDYRCQLGAPWRLDEPEARAGVAPYHLITKGSAWLDTPEQKDIRLETGDIIVLSQGSAHCLRDGSEPSPVRPSTEPTQVVRTMINDGSGPRVEVLCGQFRFDPDVAGVLFNAMPSLVHIRSAERADLSDMQALITMLRTETEVERLGSGTVVRQLASVLFAMVIRAWLEQAAEVPGMFGLLADARLRHALQAMLTDPAHAWSVNELADLCHLSRATFARHFQKCAGTSPGDMLMKTRMAQAAQWLVRDARPVAAIGEAVGYQSEAAFSRAFSRMFGMGPGQYRRTQTQSQTQSQSQSP